MTFAQAAQKAIELGGKYDGHELPEDINNFTKNSAKNLVGLGLMAVAKDAYPRDGQSQSYVVGFAEVEVDTSRPASVGSRSITRRSATSARSSIRAA